MTTHGVFLKNSADLFFFRCFLKGFYFGIFSEMQISLVPVGGATPPRSSETCGSFSSRIGEKYDLVKNEDAWKPI